MTDDGPEIRGVCVWCGEEYPRSEYAAHLTSRHPSAPRPDHERRWDNELGAWV